MKKKKAIKNDVWSGCLLSGKGYTINFPTADGGEFSCRADGLKWEFYEISDAGNKPAYRIYHEGKTSGGWHDVTKAVFNKVRCAIKNKQ